MTTIRIYPYGPSESSRILSTSLQEVFPQTAVLRREGSRYRPRNGHYLINYGSSEVNMDLLGLNVFNQPEAVRLSSNKIRSFERFQAENIPTPAWTTNFNTARQWMDEGEVVYARTRIQGHSGEGIVVCSRNAQEAIGQGIQTSNTMVQAPLYTKGIQGNRNEVRIHVAFGRVILIQKKKRVQGYETLPEYSNIVRNHSTGWIYATENLNVPQQVQNSAIQAVAALGLDFGAVDIVYKGRTNFDIFVLEVNTAPGLSGESSRAAYVQAFTDRINGVEPQAVAPAPAPTQAQEATQNARQTQEPAAPQEVQAAPAAVQREPEPVRVPEQPRRTAASEARPALINGEYYVIHHTPTDTRMVAVLQNGEFWPCGVEVGMAPAEFRIIRTINISD